MYLVRTIKGILTVFDVILPVFKFLKDKNHISQQFLKFDCLTCFLVPAVLCTKVSIVNKNYFQVFKKENLPFRDFIRSVL